MVKQSAVLTLPEVLEARRVCSLVNRFAFLVRRTDGVIVPNADQQGRPNLKVNIHIYTP